MHDISNDLVPSNLKEVFLPTAKVHSYNTRSSASKNFFIKKSRLEIKRNSFSRVGARLWNELPTKLRMQPKIKFKKKIRWILFHILELEDNYIDVEILIRQLKNYYSLPNALVQSLFSIFTFALYLTLLTAVDKMNISLPFTEIQEQNSFVFPVAAGFSGCGLIFAVRASTLCSHRVGACTVWAGL